MFIKEPSGVCWNRLDDPYSIYIPEEALDSFNAGLEGEYGGVGLVIDLVDGMITVISVFPSTPAARAGVQAGDVIISVEDRDMTGKMPADAGELLRGEAGTEVKAVFKRPYTGETFYHTFEREKIVQPMMDVKDLGDGIWYIQIAQFTETVEDQIPTVVDVLRNIGVKGIVLDLRNNPGGYLSSCTSVAEALIPEGPIVELRRKELVQEIASTSDVEPVPMVVLVNRGTASAAEILAGAIRDRGVGILVGGSTFGKASVQSIIPRPEGLGAFKLTTAEYYTPSGISLHGDGLVPDIPVEPKSVVLPRKLVAGRTMKQGVIGWMYCSSKKV